jgi:hypothetical protein
MVSLKQEEKLKGEVIKMFKTRYEIKERIDDRELREFLEAVEKPIDNEKILKEKGDEENVSFNFGRA